MALLAPQAKVFKHARESAAGMQDSDVRSRTLTWLARAETLRGERDKVAHSIVLYGRPGWHGYHPRSGSERRLSTREIVALAEQTRQHADEGVYMSIFDWPPALVHETEDEPGQERSD